MPKPKVRAVEYAAQARPVRETWLRQSKSTGPLGKDAKAKLKSLATFELRAKRNPLDAGDPVARDRWPANLRRDYGDDIPNVFRFELHGRWRGYYALVGEPGLGARVWVLYLWDDAEYSEQSGDSKK